MTRRYYTIIVGIVAALALAGCGQDKPTSASPPPTPVEMEPAEPAALAAPTPPPLDSSLFEFRDGHIVVTWADLAKVDFRLVPHPVTAEEIAMPIFSDHVKALEGQRILIGGYIIPIEETGSDQITILSAFPYAQCFFCGGAGAESVVDVLPAKPLPRLRVDTQVTFKGRLRLNDSDFDYLNYVLEDAELVR